MSNTSRGKLPCSSGFQFIFVTLLYTKDKYLSFPPFYSFQIVLYQLKESASYLHTESVSLGKKQHQLTFSQVLHYWTLIELIFFVFVVPVAPWYFLFYYAFSSSWRLLKAILSCLKTELLMLIWAKFIVNSTDFADVGGFMGNVRDGFTMKLIELNLQTIISMGPFQESGKAGF